MKIQWVIKIKMIYFRSIRPELFCKKGALKNSANFTGNTGAGVYF